MSQIQRFRFPVFAAGALLALLAVFDATRLRSSLWAQQVTDAPVNLDEQAEVQFKQNIAPLFKTYCYSCHGDGAKTADFAIDSYQTAASILSDAKRWETLQRYVHMHEMPPADGESPQPNDAQRMQISSWVDAQLKRHYAEHPDPGRVTIHRLNRAEYNNTVRDLVGIDSSPASEFPPDDSGYGFDNVGDVLSTPQMLVEKYLKVTRSIMDEAIVTEPVKSKVYHIPASLAEVGFNAFGDRGDGWVKLVSLEEDDVAVSMPILAAGDYIVRVKAYATPDGGVAAYDPKGFGAKTIEAYNKGISSAPTRLAIMLNDAFETDFEVTTDEKNPGVYEARIGVPQGKARFRASVQRIRGGPAELYMKNGRLGKEQPGVVYVKYMEIEGPLPCATRRYSASQLEFPNDATQTPDGSVKFTSAGEAGIDINAPHDGDYVLRTQAYAMQAGTEPVRMQMRVDAQDVQSFDVLADGKMEPLPTQRIFSLALLVPAPRVYECRTHLMAGKHRIAAGFANPFADPTNANPNLRQRSLTVQNLEVVDLAGEVAIPEMPAPIKGLFNRYASQSTPGRDAAQSILAEFGKHAWRRPLKDAEITRLMSLFDLATNQGDSFQASIKLAMEAAMVSSNFLFRGEAQVGPDDPSSMHDIDEFALASRLSYFIWSSAPDDELLDLAAKGELRNHLDEQVKRLLASPKSASLADNFGGQWLQFRSLETVQPDKSYFPTYDAALQLAMKTETRLFFNNIVREDCSVADFLNADYSFLNGRLAKLYGVTGVTGDEFRKVSLVGTARRGVITQGSILTLTSNPTRTSPVKRGKWVLDNILGSPPPPPPPNIPPLEKDGHAITGSLRKQMEQHRADPACASCHARMDPIGFAMENFDGIGQWRDKDDTTDIDTAGTLATGESFTTGQQMLEALAKTRRQDFVKCLAEKLLTFGLGRGVEVYDHAAVDKIVEDADANDDRFSSLILAVVKSVPFQMRRGEGVLQASK